MAVLLLALVRVQCCFPLPFIAANRYSSKGVELPAAGSLAPSHAFYTSATLSARLCPRNCFVSDSQVCAAQTKTVC